MENAIKAHCTVIVGGLPGVGKTEYVKYLTSYIPDYERVYTIEDNTPIHYTYNRTASTSCRFEENIYQNSQEGGDTSAAN